MSKFSVILAFALVACTATSLWLWQELRTEHERVHALQTRLVELERSQAMSIREAVVDASAEPHVPDTAAAVRIAVKSQNEKQPSMADDWNEIERRLLRNPKYREGRHAHRQLELASGHVDLAAVLQIPQETADRLLALLVDWELRYHDEPHPNPTNEEELRLRRLEIEEAERLQDAQLAALLGEEKVAKWKAYQASLPTRHQVYRLRAAPSAGAEPLRDDQIEPLIAAIHSEQEHLEEEMAHYTTTLTWSEGMERESQLRRDERYAERMLAAHERIRAAAAFILSKQQLSHLDDMLRRQLDVRAARVRMERAQSEMWARGKLGVSKSN